MGKKRSSQFPKGSKPQSSAQSSAAVPPKSPQGVSTSNQQAQASSSSAHPQPVRPEQMSLDAFQHIQLCLNGRSQLDKDNVTAILRLSQHLRVFGLLSAVGYLKHSKEGKVQDRTKPMWLPLLWRLIHEHEPVGSEAELLREVEQMARSRAPLYMATWRKALILSNHWNFWARAYQKEDKKNEQDNALHGSDADQTVSATG